MTNNDLLPLLLSLITARSEGEIGGPTVDFKIAQLEGRARRAGLIVDVVEVTD